MPLMTHGASDFGSEMRGVWVDVGIFQLCLSYRRQFGIAAVTGDALLVQNRFVIVRDQLFLMARAAGDILVTVRSGQPRRVAPTLHSFAHSLVLFVVESGQVTLPADDAKFLSRGVCMAGRAVKADLGVDAMKTDHDPDGLRLGLAGRVTGQTFGYIRALDLGMFLWKRETAGMARVTGYRLRRLRLSHSLRRNSRQNRKSRDEDHPAYA